MAAGRFHALVNSVLVECTDTSSSHAKTRSYVYVKNASAFTLPAANVMKQTAVTNGAPRAFRGVRGWGADVLHAATCVVIRFN